MTGGSLGLRSSGSYGSLQAQPHNGAALPIQSTSVSVSIRKPQKMLLQSSREKERFLLWICKLAGRRKIGMLLVLIASAAVILSFISAMSKGLTFLSILTSLYPVYRSISRCFDL